MYQPYPGAATSLLGIAIDLLTISDTKTAIARRSPDLTPGQLTSTQHVLIAGFIAGGVIAAVVRVWAVVVWLAGLAAVVFLWRRESSAYFRPSP
jgi:hypothetical protein